MTAANIATTTTPMDDLNNDCLREIFLCIDVHERIKLRRVCKRWCTTVDDCWRAVRKVNIFDILSSSPDKNKPQITGTQHVVQIRTSGQKLIEGVMKRCGDVVTKIGENRDGNNNSSLAVAIKHCRNIELLEIKLKTKADDKNASQLLAVNKKLKALYLRITFKNAKVCFRKIPTEHLEILHFYLYACDHPSTVVLIGQKEVMLRCSSSLREFKVDCFDDEFVKLVGQKTSLEKLELRFVFPHGCTRIGLCHVLNLKNLRKIVLVATPAPLADIKRMERCFPPITDQFLMAMSEHLRLLEIVAIGAPDNVTNEGFKSLASLKKLRELAITECPTITDEFFIFFARLEKLRVMGCSIRDKGVIELLEESRTLHELSLEDSFITNDTLVAAVNATKKRDNGICLKLYIANTDTTPETLSETSPLLKIFKHYMYRF